MERLDPVEPNKVEPAGRDSADGPGSADDPVILATSESLWQTVKRDFSSATGARIVGVIVLLAWMGFQWGFGNDILLPPIVARAFEAVDDGKTWLSGIAAIAAGTGAGSAFWGFTQAIDAVIVLTGLRLIPNITARISNFLRGKGWVKPFADLSLGTRFLIAYASGASILCLVDVFATGRPGLRSRGRMVAQAVGLAIAGVAIAIMVVCIVIAVGSRVPATEGAAEFVLRYARNPLTWLVIYGSIVGISALGGRIGGRRETDLRDSE